MFNEVITNGLKSGDTSLSSDEAKTIVSGGLAKFMNDFKLGNRKDCEEDLFYIAKASCSISPEEKEPIQHLIKSISLIDIKNQLNNTS